MRVGQTKDGIGLCGGREGGVFPKMIDDGNEGFVILLKS